MKSKEHLIKEINSLSVVSIGKRIILNILLIILFIYFQKGINAFIEKYLTYDGTFSNKGVTFLLIIISIIVLIGLFKKSFIDKYLPTLNYVNTLSIVLFCLLFFKLSNIEKKWEFSSATIFNFKLAYIDFAIFLIFTFLIFNIIRFIIIFFIFKPFDKANNQLLNDDPIEDDSEDKLNYSPIVEKTTNILINENHEKSLTIGLVGPWGNGKSSVLNLINRKLIESKKNDLIIVNFQPYLNHKEDDIINEFFISLSNELSKYNGKLSDILNEYSEKVTNLYENKNIFSLIEEHVTNFKDTTASELYDSINAMLTEINKKIIVFVDDLDRLNEKEILQILKLIRNTADFRNTIFLVAMDKQYVINRLKNSEDILNSKFIDKFFQLEIYLPEINIQILKDYFIKTLIVKLNPEGSSDLSLKITDSINSNDNLFNDYITNFRDVKRVINQITFDFPFTEGEINFKDFVNFTYFKLKFPQFIKILKEGKNDFLEIDEKGFYNFKIKNDVNKKQVDILDSIRRIRIKKNDNLDQYILHEDELMKKCILSDNIIDCEDKILFIKTLAYLFGESNIVEDVDSIKYENNFRMLIEQKVYYELFKNSEFKQLLSTISGQLIEAVKVLFNEKKITQLINRIEYFNSKDENEIKQAIKILIILYDKRNEYQLYESDLLRLISKLVEDNFKSTTNKKEFSQWLKENIFEDVLLTLENKIFFISHLLKAGLSNYDYKYWNLNEDYLFSKLNIYFEDYLKSFDGNLWDVNDYSFYYIYNTIKHFEKINLDITAKIIEFWRRNKIEFLCAQVTDLDPFSNVTFNISKTVREIFNSEIAFINFVSDHNDKDEIAIKEFLKLYKILTILNFRQSSIFEFNKSSLMIKKLKHNVKTPGRINNKDNENIVQLILETNDKEYFSLALLDDTLHDKYGNKWKSYNHNKLYYLLIYIDKTNGEKEIIKIIQDLYHNVHSKSNWNSISLNVSNILKLNNFLIDEKNGYYMKLLSIQPPLKNDSPNYETYT